MIQPHQGLRCQIAAVMSIAFFYACSHEPLYQEPVGRVRINLGVSLSVSDVSAQVKAASPDTFRIEIYNAGGENLLSFPRADQMPELIELPQGDYYAVAHSGNDLPAAFGNPYYYGQSEIFRVEPAGETSALINCRLSNIRVSVVYSSAVRENFSEYSTRVSSESGSLVFEASETRAGYFQSGPLNIEASLYYPDGGGGMEEKNLSGTISDPVRGRNYEILVDASPAEGSVGIVLTLDETYETEEIAISDDLIEGPIGFGDLLITEIMFNPSALGDAEGEYLEIMNMTDAPVSLNQLVLVRAGNGVHHTVGEEFILQAGDYAVLGRTEIATDEIDYVYGSSITLPNAGEEIQLRNYGSDGTDGSVIFAVNYGGAGFPASAAGASIELQTGISDPVEAANGNNWCLSSSPFSTGDFGTPGEANVGCP